MSEQPTVRWRRRKEDRPSEIMRAALACFKERGYAATRLEDVAIKAGVTKGTIYLYYASKEELFKAVVSGELVPNLEFLEVVLDAPGSAAEKLERLFNAFVQHVAPSPASVIPKLVLADAGNFPELAQFYRETIAQRGFRLIASVLNRGIADGEFRPVDVEHTVFCIIGPLIFTLLVKHSLEGLNGQPIDAVAICRTHLDLILHGLTASPRKRRRRLTASTTKAGDS